MKTKIWTLREWNEAHGGKQPNGILPESSGRGQEGPQKASEPKKRPKTGAKARWRLK